MVLISRVATLGGAPRLGRVTQPGLRKRTPSFTRCAAHGCDHAERHQRSPAVATAECARGESGRRFAPNPPPAATRNCCRNCRCTSVTRRSDVFQPQDQTRRADIAEMPDFVRVPPPVPQDHRRQMIVRVGQNKNSECLAISFVAPVILRELTATGTMRTNVASRLTRSTVRPVSFQQFRAFPGSRARHTGDGFLRADADPAPRISNRSFRQRS